MDASKTGQSTLNWLALSILNFGMEVAPIGALTYDQKDGPFGDTKDAVECVHGVLGVKPILVEIPDAAALSQNTQIVSGKWPSTTPPGMEAHPIIASRRFPIWMTAKYHWDDLHIVVSFVQVLDAHQRSEFRNVLESWFTIAEFGGLGGCAIHSYEKIRFEKDKAHMRLDMGEADEAIALQTLAHILEGYDSNITPVESLQLGK